MVRTYRVLRVLEEPVNEVVFEVDAEDPRWAMDIVSDIDINHLPSDSTIRIKSMSYSSKHEVALLGVKD